MFNFIENLGLKEGFRKIYTGEDAIQKHMVLFLLTGIPAMLSSPLNHISKNPHLPLWGTILVLIGLVSIVIISIYMGGYLYGVMHNSFEENSPKSILPNLDMSWFKIFFKGFPVQATWFFYLTLIFLFTLMIIAVLGAFTNIPTRMVSITAFALGFVVLGIFLLSLPFVFARFTENYSREGLYNPILPIKEMCKSFKSFVLLILAFAPIFILTVIVGYIGLLDNVFSYIMTAVGAYLWLILQYCANYCYIQIYKKELK